MTPIVVKFMRLAVSGRHLEYAYVINEKGYRLKLSYIELFHPDSDPLSLLRADVYDKLLESEVAKVIDGRQEEVGDLFNRIMLEEIITPEFR